MQYYEKKPRLGSNPTKGKRVIATKVRRVHETIQQSTLRPRFFTWLPTARKNKTCACNNLIRIQSVHYTIAAYKYQRYRSLWTKHYTMPVLYAYAIRDKDTYCCLQSSVIVDSYWRSVTGS